MLRNMFSPLSFLVVNNTGILEAAMARNYSITSITFPKGHMSFLNWIFSASPCFPVAASKVHVIHDPEEFYSKLIENCQKSVSRISIASLYFGTGHLEKRLVEVIKNNLDRNRDLEIKLLLDYQRGTRGAESSRTLLQPLVNIEPTRCKFALYHTPYLRGLYKKIIPQRWNELIGLQHMKIYITDDTVILSGANCSHDYFTNRQDRYIAIENKDLADFYSGLIEQVQNFSLECSTDGVSTHIDGSLSPYIGDVDEFVNHARSKVNDYLSHWMDRQRDKGYSLIENQDTWIFPLIEMGQLGIHNDSLVTQSIMETAPVHSMLKVATGYFNLTSAYMRSIIHDCQANSTLLMAHPNANGFKGASGPAGGIPDAYSLIAKRFYQELCSSGKEEKIKLLEYERPGWTFHAKGLWYYPPESSTPCMTLVGSPNLGERSVRRDLETQIALISVNVDLQRRLHEECDRLHRYAHDAGQELVSRTAPAWVHMAVNMFRNYF